MTWHNLEHSTYLREQGEASLQTFCLDTYLSELAKSNPIQETCCSQDSETDTCQSSQSGTMYAHSTEHHGEDQLMFFAEDSHVKTSLRRVKEQELEESVRDYGRNMRDSLEKCGLSLSLPKTHLCFALGDLELSSKTWPRWGIMLDGECSELGMSVRRIKGIECGSLPGGAMIPTPVASDGTVGSIIGKNDTFYTTKTGMPRKINRNGKDGSVGLGRLVQMWPTLRARDWKDTMGTVPPSRVKKPGLATLGQMVAMTRKESAFQDGEECPSRGIVKDTTKKLESLETSAQSAEENTLTANVLDLPKKECNMKNSTENSMQGKAGSGTKTPQKGTLNPMWVAWLMGWPIGWTDLKPLETDRFRSVQQWHSLFSQKD